MTYRTVARDVRQMFGSIAARYDLTNTVLSFGTHHIWKRHFIAQLASNAGGTVVDLCTGTGDLVPLIARRWGGRVIGADFCLPMLEVAERRFHNRPFLFLQGDALRLPLGNETVDSVTVSFGVRNFEDLESGLREIARILKPGGKLLILEFGQPAFRPFARLYQFYSRYLMPIIGGVLTGNREAYAYLPETASRFPCGEKFAERLSVAGYSVERIIPYTFGIAYGYIATKQ